MNNPRYDAKFNEIEFRLASMQRDLNRVGQQVPKRRSLPGSGTAVAGTPSEPTEVPSCRFVQHTVAGTPVP